MNILRRVAIVASDMPALEAPVQHMGELRMLSADAFQLAGQLGVTRRAVEGAEVEVRQLAVEQVRDYRADGVRIKQQGITELGLEPGKFFLQGAVVRPPDFLQVGYAFFFGRHLPFTEQRHAIEQGRRVQPGGGAGVERFVVGRPVQVNHKPRVLGRQGAGAQCLGKVIQRGDVPVGVRQALRLGDQPGFDRRRQAQPRVGHADQQRHTALFETQNLIHNNTPQTVTSTPWRTTRLSSSPPSQ